MVGRNKQRKKYRERKKERKKEIKKERKKERRGCTVTAFCYHREGEKFKYLL